MSIEYEINLFDIALELGHTAIQPVLELHRPHKFLHIGITVGDILFLIFHMFSSKQPVSQAESLDNLRNMKYSQSFWR